jgi:hypothetical protein
MRHIRVLLAPFSHKVWLDSDFLTRLWLFDRDVILRGDLSFVSLAIDLSIPDQMAMTMLGCRYRLDSDLNIL